MTRNALGRGLSALISTPVPTTPGVIASESSGLVSNSPISFAPSSGGFSDGSGDGVRFVPLESVLNNPNQPRSEFKPEELAELAESIKVHGVLQPVLVKPLASAEGGSRFEIIAGERRWRAAKLAGLTMIPVIVRTLSDRETFEIALIENIQRSNLTPVEEARAYERLATEFNLSQSEIAARVGKERATVANYLRLLKLPSEVLQMLTAGEISMGHAKAILTIKEASAQLSLARKVVKESLSVRALEEIVSRVVVLDAGHRITHKSALAGEGREHQEGTPTSLIEVIERMRRSLGTKVTIKTHRSGRGRIEIEYFSDQELERLVDHICEG